MMVMEEDVMMVEVIVVMVMEEDVMMVEEDVVGEDVVGEDVVEVTKHAPWQCGGTPTSTLEVSLMLPLACIPLSSLSEVLL
jgi:hypothetical protein